MVTACPACRASVDAAARFCPSCGAAQPATADSPTEISDRPFAPAFPVGRLASNLPAFGGFTPGSVLAGRYRVIGLIGRGGMGEVYRADDLTLGQPVALKFLPQAVHDDTVRRERFLAEVRIARQVSHPNVCRVYDIADADGRLFLSMEYVDGEDLASLLKRIGYLPGGKSLEIARQLCAGLAAAHDKGVLHRDLKPANVMIDGRGRVRITDFGLAVAADAGPVGASLEGTPVYMAPEQLDGGPASVQSDIYALGLVMYEMCTGAQAFTGSTIAELRAQKQSETLTAPSDVTREIDPLVERVILRCLDREPRLRPSSVAQVAAALPGGDPLAAAIAAGETPSPEMVAASAGSGALRPWIAWTLLGAALGGMLITSILAPRAVVIRRYPPTRSPEVMAERAQEMLRRLGFPAEIGGRAFGLDFDLGTRVYLREANLTPDVREAIQSKAVQFWYRESPHPLEREEFLPRAAMVSSGDPELRLSNDVWAVFDREGRLTDFTAIPPQVKTVGAAAPPVDWNALFRDAGLEPNDWQPATPEWTPKYYADERVAWTPRVPLGGAAPLRVEGASAFGRPVNFYVIYPWVRPARMGVYQPTLPEAVSIGVQVLLLFGLMIGAAVGARRQLRLGRGDRRGAFRLAMFLVAVLSASWLLGESHVATTGEVFLVLLHVGETLMVATFMALMYLAAEPFVRRTWPGTIVSWTRLLAGRFADPLVGRDLLIGAAASSLYTAIGMWQHVLSDGNFTSPRPFLGGRQVLPEILQLGSGAVEVALAALFGLFIARAIFRREWLAIIAISVIGSLPEVLSSANPWTAALPVTAALFLLFTTLARVGLVAAASLLAVSLIMTVFPIVLPPTPWYAGIGLVGLAAAAAIPLCGFVLARR